MKSYFDRPDYYNMMEFTQGRWEKMSDEERDGALQDCALWLPQRKAEMHQEELRKKWTQLCPPIYRESNPKLLPNLQKFEEVQDWKFGPQGQLLIGGSRRGKTRAIWALLRRLHFQEERKICAYGPMDLKVAVSTAWKDRNGDAEESHLVVKLRRIEVLFLDDLDTIKPTEAVEETVYDLFEHRLAHGRPVMVTVNQTGKELARRFNANGRGAKIVERMRESCRVINFGQPGELIENQH